MPGPTRTHGRQRERSEATRGALVDAARALFAADGYAATALDQVVDKAGVTKGALYHHFEDKGDLFRAVYEAEQARLSKTMVEAYSREEDSWEGFFAGCRAFLAAVGDPETQRIVLLDAPSVLSWEQLRESKARHVLALIHEGLEIAVAEKRIAPRDTWPLSHFLLGAMCESATTIARSKRPREEMEKSLAEVRLFLDALVTSAP